jgi:hypothetical protein
MFCRLFFVSVIKNQVHILQTIFFSLWAKELWHLRPGIANPVVETTESREQVLHAAEIYEQVLTGLGFQPGVIPMKRLVEEDHWVFNISSPTGET